MQKNIGINSKVLSKILRTSLFIFSIAFIVFLFPREGKFKYEFQKGKPWMHEALIAPYNFPIYKTDEELSAENDSIANSIIPHYRISENIKDEKTVVFLQSFEKKWEEHKTKFYRIDNKRKQKKINEKLEELKIKYFDFSTKLLSFIYDKGIIEITDIIKLRINTDKGKIILLDNNIAEETYISEVFTKKTVIEYINKKIKEKRNNSEYEETIAVNFLESLEISKYIIPNYYYDGETTEQIKLAKINNISLTNGMVQEGEKIISKGDVVNNTTYRKLLSLKTEFETSTGKDSNFYLILLGQIFLVTASILVLYLFLLHFRKDILQDTLKTAFILVFVLLMIFVSRITINYNFISIYIVPLAILPIIIRAFYDTRSASFIHIVTIITIGFFAPNGFEFVFIQLIAGMMAIFSLASINRRSQLFLTALITFVSYSVIYFGISMIQEGDISKINLTNFAWFAGNGLLLLASYPLIYIFEKVFGFLSDVSLMELSDTNHPVLRELAEKAPGTFQHSLQVGNLAESVSFKIGGNPLLARTGALYHDIGKINISQYFIENQAPGINPHDKLEYDKSAEIIINHVTQGVEKAKKHNLPSHIIDFIKTHHGNSKVQYFYRNFIKQHPDEGVDEKIFTYPGPSPSTKEQAIVMMCDSVEAASRSLKTYTEETIDELVEKIINFQIEEDQFRFANITFKDITNVKSILKNKLINIYHSRIEYPE